MIPLALQSEPLTVDFNPFEDERAINKVISINKAQQEIFISCLLGGDEASLAYNESVSINLEGSFEIEYFKKAFAQVIHRHEALRSVLSGDGEKLIIYNEMPFEVVLHDLSVLPLKRRQFELSAFLKDQMSTPFDLNEGPLFRAFVHRGEIGKHQVTLIFHHIICDGWSFGIILEELSKLYNAYANGSTPSLPEPFQISDFAVVKEAYRNSPDFHHTENFWLGEYAEDLPVANLITDFPRGTQRSYQSNRIDQHLSGSLVKALRSQGAKIGCSMVTTMLSLFEILIFKKTRQADLIIGLPSAEQAVSEFYNLVGHCVNILPVKTSVDAEMGLNDYLKVRREYLMNVYDHQQYSFGELIEKLKTKRDHSRVPLVPIVFNIDMGMDSDVRFEGLKHLISSNVRCCETFELFVNATDSPDGLILEWNYNAQLFSAASVEAMMQDYELLINCMIKTPSMSIYEAVMQGQTKSVANGKPLLNNQSFVELFTNSVSQFQSRKAVSFNQDTLTFLSLENKTNTFASFLQGKGIKKGHIVAIAISRSIDMLTGIIAVLKTGATYLPIDPTLPRDRINYMLTDSGATILLSNLLGDVPHKIEVLDPAEIFASFDAHPYNWQAPAIGLSDTAYLLYTSGSTGRPKGVKISHGNLANLLLSTKEMPGISYTDRLLATTTISFDIATLELLLPLIAGAETLIADDATCKDGRLINNLISAQKISIIQGTPSTLKMILNSGLGPNSLKVIAGGEQLDLSLAKSIIATGASLWNMYGPTETTIYSIGKQILVSDELITIGKPIHNTVIYINNAAGRSVQMGDVGEICIGGEGVGLGYVNNNSLISEKFIFANDRSNIILYRTGDLGIMLSNGEVQCLGRIDHQIKVRGHRVESGEIETVLSAQAEISQALVIQRNDTGTDESLVAYISICETQLSNTEIILPRETDDEKENQLLLNKNYSKSLKNKLKTLLPDYMVPDFIVAMRVFPLTASGKIDRDLLLKPEKENYPLNQEIIKELNATEQLLMNLWKDALGLETLGIMDDFFEMGGNSLMAVRLMVALEKKTGIRLPLNNLLTHSTIEKLATQIHIKNNDRSTTIIPIRTGGSKDPVYLIHGSGLNVLLFKSIIPSLDDDQPIYGVQAVGLDRYEDLPATIEDIAKRYIDEILEIHQNGPYNIVGYSLGGFIAFEMAKQLKALGKTINLLGVIDTDTGHNGPSGQLTSNFGYFIKRQFRKIPFIANSFKKRPVNTLKYQLDVTKKRLFKNSINQQPSDWGLFTDREKELYKKYDLALHNYALQPSELRVTLFRVSERLYFLDDLTYLGWDRFALQGVEVCEIPGDHKTFISSPHHEVFANILQTNLNKHQNAN
ncbi:non-ribosomal peptide synthetase [Pedobacter psychrodurus]|uniref:Non-ribosomal peptide synthetase n=1 Tax=Pedobacter psychrodurus TaxID=2530456 RepID=A0A4R0Q030_9SPHI|nr:non-ribosomal peptide synthetase [Pedobacter psychrodurus]TCD23398.1 non-ribosomal peptide synthetase [Pedobacter psychrodurus]